ncbi:MAG: amidohydrolase, partial [Woeseiaceae bacterium]
MDDNDSIVEAVSIRDAKIVALGTTKKVRRFAGPETQIIDLKGRAVTPGLIDVHNHFAWGAVDERFALNLAYPGVTIRSRIAEAVKERDPDEWIMGSKWDAGKLAERRDMTSSDLDAVAPENPVWLLHTSAHYGVANSRALALAGVTADTPDPDGGVIERDDDGNPTGILADQAMNLIFDITPAYTTEDFDEAIAHYVGNLSAEGITTIKDPEIDERHWDAYKQVQSRGELTVRVFALWYRTDTLDDAKDLLKQIAPFTNPQNGTGDDQVISGGVKIYIDGSGTARTAWVYDEWNKDFSEIDEGNFGLTYIEPDVLFEQIRLFHKAGIHIGTHAIGDRAIDFTMDAYDKVLGEDPVYGLRHSIIHCNIPTDHAMDLMYKLQNSYDAAYPEVQPAFLWWIGDAYAGNFGPERSPRVLPLNTFLERGIKWASSSDYDVSPFAPRYGLWSAIARQTLFGTHGEHPWGIEESISVQDALKSYTTWAARQVFLEDKIGTIEAGKYADIVVWDRDPYSVSTEELKEMNALLTIFDGTIVHRDAALD